MAVSSRSVEVEKYEEDEDENEDVELEARDNDFEDAEDGPWRRALETDSEPGGWDKVFFILFRRGLFEYFSVL